MSARLEWPRGTDDDDATGSGTSRPRDAARLSICGNLPDCMAATPSSAHLDPVRPVTLAEIERARTTLAGTALRTPLVRLELGAGRPDIRLKLENLQPTNSYKLRGAVNAVALLSESERKKGVWTISAGNAGQGIAYAARQAGVACSVVVIDAAPAAKIERM